MLLAFGKGVVEQRPGDRLPDTLLYVAIGVIVRDELELVFEFGLEGGEEEEEREE
jgi:hypothetical protein